MWKYFGYTTRFAASGSLDKRDSQAYMPIRRGGERSPQRRHAESGEAGPGTARLCQARRRASETRRRICQYAEEASEARNAAWRCLAKPA